MLGLNNKNIASLLDDWIAVLKTGQPNKVAALYDSDAMLLPTVSNKVRRNLAEIEDYFVQFLALEPKGSVDESNIRIFDKLAINSGIYTFLLKDGLSVQARFTFVYRWNGLRWMILEHHSSRMPENL